MNLSIFFCTLDSCVSYYLVAAEIASDCFDVIDRTEDIRGAGAYPSALKIEFCDAMHLIEHRVTENDGKTPLTMEALKRTVSLIPTEEARVLWRHVS